VEDKPLGERSIKTITTAKKSRQDGGPGGKGEISVGNHNYIVRRIEEKGTVPHSQEAHEGKKTKSPTCSLTRSKRRKRTRGKPENHMQGGKKRCYQKGENPEKREKRTSAMKIKYKRDFGKEAKKLITCVRRKPVPMRVAGVERSLSATQRAATSQAT